MKRIVMWGLVGVLAVSTVCAQGAPGVGAGAFLRRGLDARALAMGGAYVALADGYSAIYWNPAGLARAVVPQVGGMFSEIYGAGIFVNFVAGAASWELGNTTEGSAASPEEPRSRRLGIGASLTEMATEVRGFDEWGDPLGLIRYSEAVFSLAAATWVRWLGYVGAALKVYRFVAPLVGVGGADATASGVALDVGLAVPLAQGLWVGLSGADIGDSGIQWRNTPTEPLDIVPGRYTAGAAYVAADLLLEGDHLAAALDVSVEPRVELRTVRGGVEYAVGFLSIRGGATLREGLPLSFSAGAGVRLIRLSVDAAWVQNRELVVEGAGHTIVLSAVFRF